ncbi:aldehyde dehydrogenase (NADP(+)), partial [Streptomyces sp. S9]|nr:aldehyde dehydrogenase (NADP(+)) [Streptomyces sp. S9]
MGRLIDGRMPTGVAVSAAMNHGSPYPSTGHPGFTAVGMPSAIRRFAALHCYDHVRAEALPEELRDRNPGGLSRWIDGRWTLDDIGA